jgi:hypothetical protein
LLKQQSSIVIYRLSVNQENRLLFSVSFSANKRSFPFCFSFAANNWKLSFSGKWDYTVYTYAAVKQKVEAQAIFFNPLTLLLIVQTEVFCLSIC